MSTPPLPEGVGRAGPPDEGARPQMPPAPADAVRPAPDPGTPLPPPPEPNASEATDLFFPMDGEPSDDSPTVISRMPPRAVSSEDVFSGTLRGRKLAHFELIEPIGVGGMAAVIRARDLQLERQVALKILPPEMAADPENIRRFHQEARAAAKLDHENIARVFYCGEDQKLHFIAFEFVEGMNLRALIERRGRLPVDETIRYMLQVATGLAHAAERGVIHRDIKPSNIIITPHARAKLVDMGLARQLDLHRDQALTQSGVTLGTFDYISPEQALEPRDADVRSDIYSLGCTFYHALTGQPPVPEGTAAKKLHHHQHVAPVDPRQLNPDIPDEVAAILARMMAKDLKERYQRPEHLVQHLMQAAQKLGAISDLPDGVLFVDAPLPAPPRPRPVLLAVAAAVILVGLIVLLGQAPLSTARRDTAPGLVAKQPDEPERKRDLDPPVKQPDTPPSQDVPRPPQNPPAAPSVDVADAKALADAVKRAADPNQPHEVHLTGDVNLTTEEGAADGGPGLMFDGEGGTLTIAPKDPGSRPTISFQFPNLPSSRSLWTALTVRSGKVILRGLRFVIDAHESGQDSIMAGLCSQGGQLQVEDCLFLLGRPSPSGRLSAFELTGPRPQDAPLAATFLRCCFFGVEIDEATKEPTKVLAGRQNALTVTAAGAVRLDQCAFGPGAAAVSLQNKGESDKPLSGAQVTMDHCTVLLGDDSAAFRLQKVAFCTLEVAHSLFSHPGSDPLWEAASQAFLIRQTDGGTEVLSWKGSENRYHNLDDFWARPGQPPPGQPPQSLDPFLNALKAGNRGDDNSQLLLVSPWGKEAPLKDLDSKDAVKMRQAFQVNTDLAELRLLPGKHLVGVERFPGSSDKQAYTVDLPDPDKAEATAGKQRVVDPSLTETGVNGYPSLAQALADAKPGDVILIRHNGLVPIKPVRLDDAAADLTIRPYKGYQPVLTLDKTDEEDAALFRLHDGKLKLDHLEFLLHPANGRFKSQSVVAAVGEGACTAEGCVFTLEAAQGVPLAVVKVADLAGVMKMDMQPARPTAGHPVFNFANCFVRGDGDLVAARAGRPFELQADNCLVALAGSFLNREAGGDDALPAAGVGDAVQLTHVTAYLTGNLVRFRARDVRGLVPVHFNSVSDCLFVVPAGTGKALVHLEGPETSDDGMHTLFSWQGTHNAYLNFPQMLDQQPAGDSSMVMAGMLYTQEKWKSWTGDRDPAFRGVRLADLPPADVPLSRVTPGRFKVTSADDPQPSYGAAIDQLPKGTGEGVMRVEK